MSYKKRARQIWMDRAQARRILREYGGSVFVSQSIHVSPKKVKEFDAFDIQVYHPEVFANMIEKYKLNEKDFE